MPNTNRRNMLRVGLAFVALPSTLLHLGCASDQDLPTQETEHSPDSQATGSDDKTESTAKGNSMQIQYLEIVTADVDAVCQTYSKLHGVTFSDADQNLGGARTAELAGGGILGVRAPMRDTENPVVRPYVLVHDIQVAVDAAAEAGCEVALPPTEIAGHGTCAIVIQGGIESGLWQI
ncbi:MAG: putative enzyme related to lactoylglutathione lyase [Mariniblastus sp.]|jgi:predicted enzyme related to lactoylglutathione lyase